MLGKQMKYAALVCLTVCPLVAVACSGDDSGSSSKSSTGTEGSGGSSMGGTGGSGASSTSGKSTTTSGKSTTTSGSGGDTTSGSGGDTTSGSGGDTTSGSGGDMNDTGGTGGTTSGSGGTTATGGTGGTGGGGGMAGEAGMGGEGGAPPAVNLLVNGDFEAYMDGWQNEPDTGKAFAQYAWDHQGISHWSDSVYSVSTYQTIDEVPNGTYSFSIYAVSGGGFDSQYIFARGFNASDANEEMTMSLASVPSSGYTEDNKVTLSGIPVTSGSVTVGVHSESNASASNSWANFDDAVFIME